MKRYLAIIGAFWQRALTYRFTVFTYRIGEIGEMLVLILMWTAIYGGQTVIGGLTVQEMITYLLIGNFFNAIVRNYLAGIVARDIKDGKLSMFLVKPMSYFSYILSQEIGRISVATIMSVASSAFVIFLFADTFIWNADAVRITIIFVMILFAFVIELFLSYLIGLVAFWTDEVDGMYATFERIKKFFSGGYFPISLLPAVFVQVSLALPFAYSFFVPAQLYLGKIDIAVGLRGLLVQLVWMAILYLIIRIVWSRGLRRYEGTGM